MSKSAAARRQRCLALLLAIAFGVLLAVTSRTWPVVTVAAIGIVLAGVTYLRNCRGREEERAEANTDPGPRV